MTVITKPLGTNGRDRARDGTAPSGGARAKRGILRHPAGLMLIGAMLFTTSAGVALPPISVASDLLAMIAARSPGAREGGVLSNKMALASAHSPGSGLSTPEWAPVPDAAALPADPGAIAPAGAGGGPEAPGGIDRFGSDHGWAPDFAPGFSGNPGPGGPVGYYPVGGSSGGSGGGSSGGGSGGGTQPTSPVPDADMWILMVVGFALLGARLRRKPRVRCA